MSASRYILLLCVFQAALLSCQGAGHDQGPGSGVPLYSESALDGDVIWVTSSTYTGSNAGTSVNIGDNSAQATMRCVVSFDVSALPAGAQIDSATLRMYQNATHVGNSYGEAGGLGDVYVDNIAYTSFAPDVDLFGSSIHQNIGTLAITFTANTWHELDVTTSAEDEVSTFQSGRLQFRIYHHYEDNSDFIEDSDGWVMGDSASNKPELVIVYH